MVTNRYGLEQACHIGRLRKWWLLFVTVILFFAAFPDRASLGVGGVEPGAEQIMFCWSTLGCGDSASLGQ